MDNTQIENTINEIRKRSGTVTVFNKDKISNAIFKALAVISKDDRGLAEQLTDSVVDTLLEPGFSNESNFLKKYESSQNHNHTIGKRDVGENNHQKSNFANWSKDIGFLLLNENNNPKPKSLTLNHSPRRLI